MTMKQMWARIIRRLTGREVLPKEIKRIRVLETPLVTQVTVDVVPKVSVNEIDLKFTIKGEEKDS